MVVHSKSPKTAVTRWLSSWGHQLLRLVNQGASSLFANVSLEDWEVIAGVVLDTSAHDRLNSWPFLPTNHAGSLMGKQQGMRPPDLTLLRFVNHIIHRDCLPPLVSPRRTFRRAIGAQDCGTCTHASCKEDSQLQMQLAALFMGSCSAEIEQPQVPGPHTESRVSTQ